MLINCALYKDGLKVSDLDPESVGSDLNQPGAFVWVASVDPPLQEIHKMQAAFDLHPLAVEDALKGHQRPKIEEYGNSLFAVIHILSLNRELSIGELNIFVGENYVYSVRTHSDINFLGVRQRCESEPNLLKQGSSFVLYALIDSVVDRYYPIIDQLESELEDIEDNLFKKSTTQSNIERLFDLKKKVMVVKHAVSPLMEAVGKFSGGRVSPICSNSTEYFRDLYSHLQRINAVIESMREAIGTAIQVSISEIALEQNNVQKRLAAWAAIFAVATAFAGIWGMNFE